MKYIYVILILLMSAVAFCEKSMVEFNPEFEDRLLNAQKLFKTETPTFNLFAFTDVHSAEYEFGRLMEFYHHYDKYFDNAVCLGDIVENYTVSSDFLNKNPYSDKLLFTVGNHDVFTGKWDNTVSMEEMFSRFFSPFIDKWGVVYEKGKTYYYKDYPEKKIRFIVIDSMLHDAESNAQIGWFKDTLRGAREKGFHVVCATHFPMLADAKPIKCVFTNRGREINSIAKVDKQYADFGFIPAKIDDYMSSVNDFRNEGGVFVCWLSGHTHYDLVELDQKYNQMCITMETCCVKWSFDFSDSYRTMGLKSQDLANAIIVDTHNRMIKIVRAGCDTDKYMRHKDMACISYVNFELID